ncbi:MAG: hypothetical protein NTZ17_21195, partial [Phycisphaerae bacterium]|nr:hypothetical protein [Phycisphaerae bacterium]
MKTRLLWAILMTGVPCSETPLVHASASHGEATAHVVVQVPPHITVSAPATVSVDLQNRPISSPISASVRFLVSANTQEVELQVACTDLYRAGDPTSAYGIPVAGAGARITCEHGHASADGNSLLQWQHSPSTGLLPAGWTGAVSEAGTFTASPAATFS